MVRTYDTNGCDIVVIYLRWLKLVGSETITNVNRQKAYQLRYTTFEGVPLHELKLYSRTTRAAWSRTRCILYRELGVQHPADRDTKGLQPKPLCRERIHFHYYFTCMGKRSILLSFKSQYLHVLG